MTSARSLLTDRESPVRRAIRAARSVFTTKTGDELSFWRGRYKADGGRFHNSHFERVMLAMAGESSASFVGGKVVADFGCGPRGSLVWAHGARERIGIDVLADAYVAEFWDAMQEHGMVYLKCTERVIPLPADSVDVMFTLNAMDHVDDFEQMSAEVVRVLKPGGLFVGSFNLHEPVSPAEPQSLDEARVREALLDRLTVESTTSAERGAEDDLYGPIMRGEGPCPPDRQGFLWVRATKP